ncbi:hypothetical protein OG568_59885 (plasmid) [Streptomyces sp. NBC_01450]|uniref:hypothetical protein n=1 Tax=Streptomyces sp. NBC_01450 TaxID=2903871 RepID=UPI002E35B448|nr:hypothetical protein [Streptomyces sp. NBC_01450]
MAQVCDFYRRQGVPSSFMIAPPLLPSDWTSVAANCGLTEGTQYTKLWCAAEAASAPTGVAFRQVV